MKKFKSLFNEVNEQPEHEITVGNYTTKFFYMCGSAQKVMSANSDKEGAEELTKMQDELYKIEKEVMDAGEATEEQKEQARDIYNKIMSKAGEVGLADEIDDYPDSMTYRYDNVITLRSFSKAYGLGGVRIGYGLAHDELISNLLKVKVPFEPSFTAQVAGIAALDDPEFLLKTIKANKQGMKFFKQELNILGVEHIPSAANFILRCLIPRWVQTK